MFGNAPSIEWEIAGSNPVLITEGANPETWKDKVGTGQWRIG